MNNSKIHVGCSGFYNRHWKGIFYPEKLAQKNWFAFYAEHFDSLELNTTFYKFPTEKSLKVWFDKSPDDFLFAVKAPKLITHMKKFNDCKSLISDFYLACDQGLQHKLACTLFQCPPSFHYSEDRLAQIIDDLNPGFRNVVEFRHTSWWRVDVYKALAENQISFCTPSHPNLPETLIQNTELIYARLHGNRQMFYSEYTEEELQTLLNGILANPEVTETFVFFNNTAGEAGILNALSFKNLMLKGK